MAEPTNDTQPVAPITTPVAPTTPVVANDGAITNVPPASDEIVIDKRLYTEDGKFNQEGAKEFFKERKAEVEKYEKRLKDMRRIVGDGKAAESKDAYFQDYVPGDKYAKFFDEKAPGKDDVQKITNKFAETYFEAGLTKNQAAKVSNTMLETLEAVGVLDVKTPEEKAKERQVWIDEQKKVLGSNADNIIREARMFVERSDSFDANAKKSIIDLMEHLGAPFIDTIHQLKDAFGERAGKPPASVLNLGGLPSDIQLKQEYLDPKTTPIRRDEIIKLRAKAGRTGRLMDAQA